MQSEYWSSILFELLLAFSNVIDDEYSNLHSRLQFPETHCRQKKDFARSSVIHQFSIDIFEQIDAEFFARFISSERRFDNDCRRPPGSHVIQPRRTITSVQLRTACMHIVCRAAMDTRFVLSQES